MEELKELIESMKDEIVSELMDTVERAVTEAVGDAIGDAIGDALEDTLADALEDALGDAVAETIDGVEDGRGKLWVLSQDKKMLAPISFAWVRERNSDEFPFEILVRMGIHGERVFGVYESEEAAKDELKRMLDAAGGLSENARATYEMN